VNDFTTAFSLGQTPIEVYEAIIDREDVDQSFGPASVVLRGYGRKVGAGPGLTCYPA
jgi:hypothetical protein